jgi:hypothetical protein
MSYADIFQFIQNANNWLSNHKDETRIHYALRKLIKQCNKLIVVYQEKIEELNIDNCSVDEKGIILRDERNEYKFTKEGLKKRNEQRREEYEKLQVITPFYITDKSPLSEADIDNFRGFIVETDYTKEGN